MRKLRRNKTWAVITAIIISVSVLGACQIGLGSAVDVQAPQIEIKTPETSDVIRDSFAIGGGWSDDGSIKNIEVSLKNTGTNQKFPVIAGSVIQEPDTSEYKGTWNAVIRPVEEKIPDGNYEATVTIKDNGGHQTVVTRSFIIDNTPPVVVLQRPSTKATDTDSDVFGQTLTFSGQSADDNNVPLIRVKFFSDPECLNEIHHVDLLNVPPTISLDVAKFAEDTDNDYAKIYGNTIKDGKKPPVYCSITAYDEAKRIPVSDEDKKEDDEMGNSTDIYYLYDDIYADVLSEYKVMQLYSIMNGTYKEKDASRAAQVQGIEEVLKANEVTKGKLSLNPANNPTYKVIGREGLKKDGSDFTGVSGKANELTNESKITLKADTGLDAIPLNRESIRVYLLRCDDEGNPVDSEGHAAEDREENRIYPTDIEGPEKSGSGYNITARIKKEGNKDKDGNEVQISVNQKFLIRLEGEDTSHNEIAAEDNKTFGFRLASNAAAPLVEIKTYVNPKEDGSFANEGKEADSMIYVPRYKPEGNEEEESVIRFEGKITAEEGEIEVTVSIDDGEAEEVTEVNEVPGRKGEFTFSKEINVGRDFENPGQSKQHNIVFSINQADTTRVTKSIMYQVEKPTVTLSRVEPTAYKYLNEKGDKEQEGGRDKKYLNGKNVKLNVTIIAGAAGLDKSEGRKPVIEFIQEREGEERVVKTMESPTFGETEEAADTTDSQIFTEGKVKIRITAYDMAGNKTVSEETYYIDQATDTPVILPKNAENSTLEFTKEQAEDAGNTTKNVYSANQTVSYKLIDDDGLVEASYRIYKEGEEEAVKSDTIKTINGAVDYQLEVTMEADPATYRVELETKDRNTENLTGIAAKTNRKTFYVRVTAAAPTIESIKIEKTNVKNGDVIRPKIKIKSDQVPFTLTRTVKGYKTNESGETEEEIISTYTKEYTKESEGLTDSEGNALLNKASPEVTDEITIEQGEDKIKASGKYTIEYVVTDRNGKSGKAQTEITADFTAPKITGVKIEGENYSSAKWYNTTTLGLIVSTKDKEGETEIKGVTYSTDGNTWRALSFDRGTEYVGSVNIGGEGSRTLYIRSEDNAGNVTYYDGTSENGTTVKKAVNVKIDITSPEVEEVKEVKEGEEGEELLNQETAYYYNGKRDIALTIKAADGTGKSGVKEIYVLPYNKLTDETMIAANRAGESGQTYTYTIRKGAINKSGPVYARIYDKAGNYRDENLFSITYDPTAPVLQSMKLEEVTGNETDGYKKKQAYQKEDGTYYINPDDKTFTLSGIATDNLAVGSVNVTMKAGTTEKYNKTATEEETADNGEWTFTSGEWSFNTIDMSSWGGDKTEVNVTVTVTDKANNTQDAEKSIASEFTIIFDKKNPESLHEIDAAGKDLVFRVSDADNDDISPATAAAYNLTWDTEGIYTEVDTKAGGKYAEGTFGNSITQKVRGVFEDDGSGIKRIYYAVYDRTEENKSEYVLDGSNDERYDLSEDELNELMKKVIGKNLYFEPEDREYKRVFYNVNQAEYDATSTDKAKAALALDGTQLKKKDPKNNDELKAVTEKKNGVTYYKFWKIVPSTYSFIIPKLTEGSNYLVLVAEDNAGNRYLDRVTVKLDDDGNPETEKIDAEFSNFSLNLDMTAPKVESTYKTVEFSNGQTKYSKISVSAWDPEQNGIPNSSSGVKSVVFSRDGEEKTVEAQASGTDTDGHTIYTADISEILPESGSPSIYATVTDVASTSSKKVAVNITIDKTAPEVTIEEPKTGSAVNKTIKLVMTASDVNGSGVSSADADKPELYYSTKPEAPDTEKTDFTGNAQTGWVKLDTVPDLENGKWKFNIDTTQFNATGTDKSVYFTVSSKDNVENKGYAKVKVENTDNVTAYKLVINQDGDRPEIKMNQVKKDGSEYLTSKTVFGSVKDDDGEIQKLWVWSKKLIADCTAEEPENAPWEENATGWKEFGPESSGTTLENNNWQIESGETDGETKWFWALEDKNGGQFWTRDSNPLKRPYIVYKGDEEKEDNTAGITFKYDTNSPEINSVELIRTGYKDKEEKTTYTLQEINESVENNSLQWLSLNGMVFGKEKGIMYMKVTVTEQTGMDGTPLAVKKGNDTYLGIVTSGNTCNITQTQEGNVYTYILGPFDMTQKASEKDLTLKIIATDIAKRTGSKEKTITVDNSADITVSRVTPKPEVETSGEFAFQGSMEDSLSSIASVEYFIPPKATYDSWVSEQDEADRENIMKALEWKSVSETSLLSWKIEFSGNENSFSKILEYETRNGNIQATVGPSFAGYDTGTVNEPSGLYLVPLWLRITDEVGNTAYVTQATDKDQNNNITRSDLKVKYNPNADCPSVVIVDPEINAEGVEKGGNFRISGTASDNEGILAVYLQVDFDNDGTFENDGLTTEDIPATKDSNNMPLKGIKASGTRNWNARLDISAIENNKTIRIRAIAVDSDAEKPLTSAWSDTLLIKVNNNIPYFEDLYLRQRAKTAGGEADPDGNVLVEREYSQDMFLKDKEGYSWFLEGKAATTSSEYISTLRAGSYEWTGTVTKTKNENNEDVKTAVLTPSQTNPSSPSAMVSYVTDTDSNGAEHDNIQFRIPVTGTSECKISITAEDAKDPKGEATALYSVNIDNTSPSFPDMYVIGDEGEQNKQGIRLYRDSYGGNSLLLGDTNYLQNSNGASFTLAGKIIEEGSGFEKAAFYIKRTGKDGKVRVYNPLINHGTDYTANRTDIAASESAVDTSKPLYINNDNLPVLKITGITKTDYTISSSDIPQEIGIGGLVYIGGLYRTITGKTGSTVTINPPYSGNETTAYFVYALVVDHTGEGENSDGGIRNDDGDGLLESFSGSTSKNFSWEASFNSANIPDGPVEIHVVAFDQAGNIGHGYTKTVASNNAPRITKVMLGTDLNGNGRFDFGSKEFSTFYYNNDDNGYHNVKSGKDIWNLDTKKFMGSDENGNQLSWKLKNGAALIPEFVGGKGPFYYKFSKSTTEGLKTPVRIASTAQAAQDAIDHVQGNPSSYELLGPGENNKITVNGTTNPASWVYSTYKDSSNRDVSNSGGSLTLTNTEIGSNGEDNDVYLCFTFWDSTDDSTPGFDTGYTILNLKVRQDLTDDELPKAVINPFKWEGTGYSKMVTELVDEEETNTSSDVINSLSSENATYVLGNSSVTTVQNGRSTVVKTVITPKNSLYGASLDNGHIELEDDWENSDYYKNLASEPESGEYDKNPKVSGKITFHGTASDNTRLSSIWFKFDDFTAYNGLTQKTENEVTLYDAVPTDTAGYTQAAWYNASAASWKNAETVMNNDHWEISVTDSSFDQNSHVADWYLSIDTAYISGGVGLDKTLSVIVLDAAGKASEVKTYQMDVVPYVTTLSTSLSSANANNPSVYDRTALGHYLVHKYHGVDTNGNNNGYIYENVTIKGFNLYDSTIDEQTSSAKGGIIVFENAESSTGSEKAFGNTNAVAYTGTASLTPVTSEVNTYTFTLPNGAKSGNAHIQVGSGDNVVVSLNNKNNNFAHGEYKTVVTKEDLTAGTKGDHSTLINYYNRLPNGVNNNRLTDDLVIDVWDFNTAAATPKNNSALDIIMKLNLKTNDAGTELANGLIGFAFCNGYKNWSMPTQDNSYNKWADSKDFIQCTGFTYSSSGISFGTCAGGESEGRRSDAYVFLTSQWDTISWTGSASDNSLRIEATGIYNDTDKKTNINKERFKSASIATIPAADGSDDDSFPDENIYLAFYDDTNGEIRFRAGTLPSGSTKKTEGLSKNTDNQYYFGNFIDRLSVVDGIGVKSQNNNYTANHCQIVAADSTDSNSLGVAGEYLSIGVLSNNVVVMVWYDPKNNNLMCSYNTTPLALEDEIKKEDNTTETISRMGKSRAGWSDAQVIIPGAGKYCNLVVDSDDGVHVAAYDSSNGDLKYAYIGPTTKNSIKVPDYANPKVCIVDSYQAVGTELTIDVAKESESGKQIPHIGYFGSTPKKPRYAYLADPDSFANGNIDGVSSDQYTGVWECGIVPSPSTITSHSKRRINVGVWKIGGERTNSITGTSVAKPGADNGKCYGNGTNNAVLGYGVKYSPTQDYVETAQMR